MELNNAQLDTLRHMLGINTPDQRIPKPYRNYAAVNPADPKFLELEKLGAVERYGVGGGSPDHYYRCTEEGKLAAMRSHRTIRESKAKRQYAAFLDLCDPIPDLTFKEFLTDPEFADIKRKA